MWPIIFEFGPFSIYSLWLMISIGIIIGSWVLIKLSQKSRLKIDIITDNAVLFLFWTIVGGRLLFIISNPTIFFTDFSVRTILSFFAIWDKGLSFWGALIGFFISFYYVTKKYGENLKSWLDIIAITLLIILIFGHAGALLDGINYGRETSMPWGIAFESGAVKYVVPIHPTQIYALIYTSILALVLYEIYKRWKVKKDGLVAATGAMSYLILRFLEEFFRGDEAVKIFGIKIKFIVFFVLIIISGIWLAIINGHKNKIEIIFSKIKNYTQKISFLKQ